jgi:radical SAM-linked protein
MKMIVVFKKTPRLRFIGHLDLMRTMQRGLRRSGLPVRYSQGFNPHILLSFAAPLSVGISGVREIMEIPLGENIEEQKFLDALNSALPADLACVSARAVDDRHASPMALLRAARYEAVLSECVAEISAAIPSFMEQKAIPATRRTKSGDKPCDIRPMIYALEVEADKLIMTLALSEDATCKPDLLLSAVCAFAGVPQPACALVRTQLYGDGLVPLEDL